MGKITIDDVKRLAKLARLELSDDEVVKFAKEFSEIVEYVEQLGKIDTEGVSPTYQVTGLVNSTRKDELKKYEATPESILTNTHNITNKQIKVNRMVG